MTKVLYGRWHFCRALHVAMQIGLYHPHPQRLRAVWRASRTVSEDPIQKVGRCGGVLVTRPVWFEPYSSALTSAQSSGMTSSSESSLAVCSTGIRFLARLFKICVPLPSGEKKSRMHLRTARATGATFSFVCIAVGSFLGLLCPHSNWDSVNYTFQPSNSFLLIVWITRRIVTTRSFAFGSG